MVITSSTRNRVGGNTPRGFESHLLRQNKDHPSGWSLFFTEGGIRKAALRNMPVACFNRRGFSAEKESHRPDLSARSIRRDGRLLAECRWHSATAVGARRPTTSKIFNGCSPQRKESHRPDLGARSIRRDGRLLVECMGCLRNISAKKISADRRNFSKGGSFSCRQKPKKKRGKVSIFACFDNNFQRLKISQIFSQILLTKGDTPAIIYFVAERQAVHRERSMRVCWNW